MKAVEASNIKAGLIGGSECAWQGCTNRFQGEMPDLWLYLLTWWSPWPEPDTTISDGASSPYCKRDAVLCPQHAAPSHSPFSNPFSLGEFCSMYRGHGLRTHLWNFDQHQRVHRMSAGFFQTGNEESCPSCKLKWRCIAATAPSRFRGGSGGVPCDRAHG
jgi:hypothetical protein